VQLAIAFMLSPKITLFVLAAGCILAFLFKRYLRAAEKVGNQKSEIAKDYIGGLTEDFNGIKDIKSNNLESARYAWLKDWCRRIESEQFLYSRIQNNSQVLYKVISTMLIASLLFISVSFFKEQPGQLIAIILIFSRLWPKFMGIQGNLQQMYACIPAFDALLTLKKDSEEASEKTNVCEQTNVLPKRITDELKCENVYFQYGPSSPYALKNINLSIKANEMTAVVGPSGAGKSTLIDILMGLLVPTEGQLVIDGKPVMPDEILSLRKSISYVPQEPFLFNGSIRENLLLVNPNVSEEDMWQALTFSASADFVSRLPKTLDTQIGDRGVMLSGGERQRLVLARAILRKPSILILDEATSALDSENESKIQESIERLKGKMTIIVIAHRLSTIRNADRILVLDQGMVTQNGSFRSLASEEKKTFSMLLQKQTVLNR
jgi:ATP-binding cassette subfamily C protein